jgi:hypothetical protein
MTAKATQRQSSSNPLEAAYQAQLELTQRLLTNQLGVTQNFLSTIQNLTGGAAVFKTTVQSGGRISIPEAERESLRIADGDLVQVILIPIKRNQSGGE